MLICSVSLETDWLNALATKKIDISALIRGFKGQKEMEAG